jgi:hypothetical protein
MIFHIDTSNSVNSIHSTSCTEHCSTNISVPSIDSVTSSRSNEISPSSQPVPSHSIPIQIPSTSELATGSSPQISNLMHLPQSHSLPTYFVPAANIAYIATTADQQHSSTVSLDLSPLTNNGRVLLISNPGQNLSQPVHIVTPVDYRAIQFMPFVAHPHLFIPSSTSSRICNILHSSTSTNEMHSSIPNKRPDNNDSSSTIQPFDNSKQFEEQLPFKKRRYAGQQLPMATLHDGDDAEASDNSSRK